MKKIAFFCLATVLLVACGQEPNPNPTGVDVTGITLSTSSLSVSVGQSTLLSYTLEPVGAKGEVTWSSSNTAVATVSNDGTVTAVATGNATITASVGSISATCAVTVKTEYEIINAILIASQLVEILDDSRMIITFVLPCGGLGFDAERGELTGAGPMYYIKALARYVVSGSNAVPDVVGNYTIINDVIDANSALTLPLFSFQKGLLNFTTGTLDGSYVVKVDVAAEQEVSGIITGTSFTLTADATVNPFNFQIQLLNERGNGLEAPFTVTSGGSSAAPGKAPKVVYLNATEYQTIKDQLNNLKTVGNTFTTK
jgi:hypothetical protein